MNYREGGSGWGTHVNPWLIHVNVWQNPLQYCKVISLQLIKKKIKTWKGRKKKWTILERSSQRREWKEKACLWAQKKAHLNKPETQMVGTEPQTWLLLQRFRSNQTWWRRRGGEEGIRGWDGWMASPVQWTWTWTNFWRWWRTERPGVHGP